MRQQRDDVSTPNRVPGRQPASSPVRPPGDVRDARAPRRPGAARTLALQRTVGNRAVVRQLQRWDWRDVVDPLGVSSALGGLIGMISSGIVDQGRFKRAAHAARQRPIWRAEWDAWGHAVCAASSASLGGEGHAWLFGQGREELQELLAGLGLEHDSYAQDTHNQAVGRQIAVRLGGGSSLESVVGACTEAYRQGRLRIGPARDDAWLPWCGDNDFHAVHRHEGACWLPATGTYQSAPENWVEAVDPGPRGLAPGSGRRPSTPLPSD